MSELERFLVRAEKLLARIERLVPEAPATDWDGIAFRWVKKSGGGNLLRVNHPHRILLEHLLGIENQKRLIDANTRQFLAGLPANNVLLTGARGTGKSSLIKALLQRYSEAGLRLIEVEKQDLVDLPEIADLLEGRSERFIIFCDDLSFDREDGGYKALKVVLDGSIAATSGNMLVYATSNRRHLMPEFMQENLETRYLGDEIHPGESVEEKISLSDRFGLWVSFYPFDQDEYLEIVDRWLDHFGVESRDGARAAALQWALGRGSRSGRVAWQFARDWAGREQLD